MKIRIKAAVVLNGQETHILANILERLARGSKGIATTQEEASEEKQVIEEFLRKRKELSERIR